MLYFYRAGTVVFSLETDSLRRPYNIMTFKNKHVQCNVMHGTLSERRGAARFRSIIAEQKITAEGRTSNASVEAPYSTY
jgi:hypothetical protein